MRMYPEKPPLQSLLERVQRGRQREVVLAVATHGISHPSSVVKEKHSCLLSLCSNYTHSTTLAPAGRGGFQHHQAILLFSGHQVDVYEFNLMLTLSTWR